MEKLKTNYLGLTLKSPVIVGSSRLTSSLKHLTEAEESGAGAVVLKSLFEEQIEFYINSHQGTSAYPEADDYLANYIRSNSVDEYISLIKNAKKNLSIPVIPSVNCVSAKGWIDFAGKMADAGADALEVNVFFMPVDRKKSSVDSEKIYFELIEKLKKTIRIPVAIKIGFRFSNVLYMIDQFYMRGVEGVVMFNRFFEPDIDVDKMSIVASPVFSTSQEMRNVLRWIAMASSQDIKIDISASTGVHSGTDALKYLLAGADTVQVCSVLYSKGIGFVAEINRAITDWMDRKGFKSVGDFRGRLNRVNYENPAVYERTQFMKYFAAED